MREIILIGLLVFSLGLMQLAQLNPIRDFLGGFIPIGTHCTSPNGVVAGYYRGGPSLPYGYLMRIGDNPPAELWTPTVNGCQ